MVHGSDMQTVSIPSFHQPWIHDRPLLPDLWIWGSRRYNASVAFYRRPLRGLWTRHPDLRHFGICGQRHDGKAVPCALVGLFHKALHPQWSDLCQYADSLWPAGTDHGLLGEADFIRIVRPAFGISAGDHLYILAGADDD